MGHRDKIPKNSQEIHGKFREFFQKVRGAADKIIRELISQEIENIKYLIELDRSEGKH